MASGLPRVAALVLGCVVLGILPACGGPNGPGPVPVTEDTGFTETFTDPPTEDTDNPVDPTVTRTTVGITIASPTLEGLPSIIGSDLSVGGDETEDTGCERARNRRGGVAVTVVSVEIFPKPGYPPAFDFGNHEHCGGSTLIAGCHGLTLAVQAGCAIEVRFKPPAKTVASAVEQHRAVLRWNLRAECIAREGLVCEQVPPGVTPSASDPVVVEWSEDRVLVGTDNREPATEEPSPSITGTEE